jgi:hypothetical protein
MIPFQALLLTTLLAAPPRSVAVAPAPQVIDAQAWRADLDTIAAELPQRHPDLFYRMSRAAWDSALAATRERLPTMTRDQAIVAFMELVALGNDGHTAISPAFDPALKLRYYPIELRPFADGLFIRSAAPSLSEIVGGKVLRIGERSADEAMALAARTVSAENDYWRSSWACERLVSPELVDGLGIAKDAEHLTLVVERDGRRRTVTISPAGKVVPKEHNPNGSIDRTGWTTMNRTGDTALWLRAPGTPYHVEWDAADSLLFVGYRGVIDLGGDNSNAAFWRRVFAMADSLPVSKLVLDVRENVGGNSFFNRKVVRGILQRPALDRKDRLFVIVGNRTFSAAMNLVLDLEHWTNATFVGEPTGNATTFFGDHVPVRLPNSGITVMVSALRWRPYDQRDQRLFVSPTLSAPMTSAAYRENRDPSLEAILAAPRAEAGAK